MSEVERTQEPSLLADRMLGKLARLLRMVGNDVEYVREGDPQEIARRAHQEGRVLLTRDKRLASRKDGGRVLYVDNNYPFHQARQVIRALELPIDVGFRRCVEDNGRLGRARPEEVSDRVPPHVLGSVKELFRCDRCDRVYWEGTHVAAMREMIRALEGEPLVAAEPADDGDGEASLRTLEPLVDLHQAFDVLFLRHRLALMAADVPRALGMFRRFAMWMRRHVEHERELVLPLYAGASPAGGYERGAAPELFENEHQKILDHLRNIEVALEELRVLEREGLEVRCLALLDREKVFVDLLEHHDHRERAYLYPALERMLAEAEKQDLLERMVGASAGEDP